MIDGPFAETKELIAGFWIIQASSKEEAVEWIRRVPNVTGEESEIEIRQVFDIEDFGDELTPELREQDARLRAQTEEQQGSWGRVDDAHRAVDAVWRIESARVIAGLARMVRDVGLAEDLASDALVAALETWPRTGVPDNPGAWLMATARNRAIDVIRRNAKLTEKTELLARDMGMTMAAGAAPAVRRRDRRRHARADLHLLPSAARPRGAGRADPADARRPQDGGDRAGVPRRRRAPIGPADLAREEDARAPRTCRSTVPEGDELDARLPDVLEVVYLIFNEGYAATQGEQWMRPGARRGRAAARSRARRARAAAGRGARARRR